MKTTGQDRVFARATQLGQAGIPGVKNIIAVGSGKGGVGKSTTAVNLAVALAADGAQVGILDADVYGPNQPLLLGVNEKPELLPNKKIKPIKKHGIQSMSIGYLVEDAPMIWRGPMISQAVQQMLNDTVWEALDYLIIDLPPGTGDIPLTLAKKVPLVGAVIVTTPQAVSLLDARKAIDMFCKLNITVLGIIENMATYVCAHCRHEEAIFGEGGGAGLAKRYDVPLLGKLPLNSSIRKTSDEGAPIVISEPNGDVAERYRNIARALLDRLSVQPINYGAKFPKIVVE